MSEHIVHTACLDDCFNLVENTPDFPGPIMKAVKHERSFAQLGSVTRSGDRFSVDLLSDISRRWETRTDDELLVPKLAFVLGWLCHRACDRQMKPIWRSMPDEVETPPTCSIYHEALIFREYHLGRGGPLEAAVSEETLACKVPADLDTTQAMDLIRTLVSRALIELHTFIPDADDVEGWIERLYSTRQTFYEDLIERYARAIAKPDPEKIKKYIEEPNFFDSEEPWIKGLKEMRSKGRLSDENRRILNEAEPESQYAQAVCRGFEYIRATGEFFTQEIEQDELSERLDIGKPGRHGGSV